MNQVDSNNQAEIYDQGYRPFDGSLASPSTRFWPIAMRELRQAWKDKWFRRLLWVAYIPLVVYCVLVVISARFPTINLNMDGLWPKFWRGQLFLAVFMTYFIGRGAVGEDLRTGALTVYFSRPVSFLQYLLGKWSAVSVGVAGVTLLPGFVLGLFRYLAEPDSNMMQFLGWLASIAFLSGLVCALFGLIILAVSSLTRRSRMAGIVWFTMFFVLSAAAEGISEATGMSQFVLMSFFEINVKMAELLLEGSGGLEPGLWLGLGHLIWMAAGFSVILIRLRRWVRM